MKKTSALLPKTLLAAGFSLWLLGLTACHTVEGAGKDIQKAGEKIEETAENAHHK